MFPSLTSRGFVATLLSGISFCSQLASHNKVYLFAVYIRYYLIVTSLSNASLLIAIQHADASASIPTNDKGPGRPPFHFECDTCAPPPILYVVVSDSLTPNQ
ncbi:hypothetical protein EV127DRAFT_442164 [Xylaria flabelliformis]|nr:hypothetical protein EV127DRAFT_442164 [Xylaria flabelliformis]